MRKSPEGAGASAILVVVGLLAGVSACEAQRSRGQPLPAAAEIVEAFSSSASGVRIAAHHRTTTYILERDVPVASRDSVLAGLERVAMEQEDVKVADVIDVLSLASRTWADEEAVARLQRIYEGSDFAATKHMALRRALQTGDSASAVKFLSMVAQRGYEGGASMAAPLAVELLAKNAGPEGKAVLADLVRRNRLMNPEAQRTAAGFVQSGVIK